jgi:hypothetical protein
MPNKACEHMRGGIPNHAMPAEVHICADGRKEECPYSVVVETDTDYVSFRQCFCGYMFRKAPTGEDEG